jgi:hypothetical protein
VTHLIWLNCVFQNLPFYNAQNDATLYHACSRVNLSLSKST